MRQAAVRALSRFSLLILLLEINVFAQTTTGSLVGLVHDPAGAVVPGAQVSARSVETGAVRKVTTDNSGAYQILNLPAGVYDMEASSGGFKTELRKSITLTVGTAVSLNFSLSIGRVNDTLVVTGEPPQVETTTASVSGILGQLGDLGRNTLPAPGLEETDLSLFKNFAFAGERYKLQFRAEAFNLLNHTNFGVQTTAAFNKQGRVIPTAGDLLPPTLTSSRQMQLGVKFNW